MVTRALAAAVASLACSAALADDNARLEACRAKLKAAQKLEVLYDLQWEKGRGPRVLAGPTYRRLPLDAKEGFAETLNCFLTAGEAGKCMNFDIRDFRSGAVLHTFRNCRLKTQ